MAARTYPIVILRNFLASWKSNTNIKKQHLPLVGRFVQFHMKTRNKRTRGSTPVSNSEFEVGPSDDGDQLLWSQHSGLPRQIVPFPSQGHLFRFVYSLVGSRWALSMAKTL